MQTRTLCHQSTVAVAFAFLAILPLTACRRDMQDQPKYKPLAASRFFSDGRSARPIPSGTIARGELDTSMWTTLVRITERFSPRSPYP